MYDQRSGVLCVVLVVVLVAGGALAQSCGSSTNSTTLSKALQYFSLCSSYIPADQIFFVPDFGFPQPILELSNAIVRILGTKVPGSPSVPPVCADRALMYFCSLIFRPCSPEGLPRAPCRSSCEAFDPFCRLAVSGVLTAINQSAIEPLLLPPCTAIESGSVLEGSSPEIAGQPVFPVDNQIFNISTGANGTTQVVSVTCNNPVLVSPIPNFQCYGAWTQARNRSTSYCQALCPLPFISRSAQLTSRKMMLVFGVIGIVLGPITFILRIAVPSHRPYPARLVLCCIGAMIWLSLWSLVPFWHRRGWTGFTCPNGEGSKKASMIIHSAFMIYTDLCLTLYWTAVSIHALIAVQIGPELLSWKTEVATHVICIGIPIVLASVAAGTKFIGHTAFTPFGSFSDRDSYSTVIVWQQYPLYWGPLFIATVISISCVVYVAVQSFRRQLKGNQIHWKRNIRIFSFIGIFIFIESFKCAYKIRIDVSLASAARALRSYVENSIVDPNAPRGTRIHDGEALLFITVIMAQPIIVYLIFVSNSAIREHWCRSFRSKSNPFTSKTSSTVVSNNASATGGASSIMES